NSLLRTLPTNWTSVQLEMTFVPTAAYQQANLALYQDDDNYAHVGLLWNSTIALTRETAGTPASLATKSVAATNLQLRMDRDETFGDLTAFYSLDGTNWLYVGKATQELLTPRLAIWVGGSASGFPNADLRRLRIATSNPAFTSTLALQPSALVFNAVKGQANTNVLRVNIYHRGPDAFRWTATENVSWLSLGATSGSVPGFCDVSVVTTGLTNGIYQAAINFTALGAVTNTTAMNVSLIVNTNGRARLATWKGGKKGAMSVWIDDSDVVMFDALNANGFKGTYALMGPGPQAGIFTTYYNAGMELGSHTH